MLEHLEEGLPDEELIARHQAGDQESFALLIRRHQRLVFGLAFQILRNREEANEATQEAFVMAFQKIHRFDGRSTFGTWLGRIVLNRCFEALRRRHRWGFLSDRGQLREQGARDPWSTLADPAPGPEGEVEKRQLADGLARLLETLSPRQRIIFILRHLEGRSTREVSLLTGLDEDSVKTHLLRAIRKLRAGLKPFR